MAAPTVAQPAACRMIGATMIVTSSSNPRTTYTVTDRGCSCPGYRFRSQCKHQQMRADALAMRPAHQSMSDAAYAKTLEACDELF